MKFKATARMNESNIKIINQRHQRTAQATITITGDSREKGKP
jgi:hypothetical protein